MHSYGRVIKCNEREWKRGRGRGKKRKEKQDDKAEAGRIKCKFLRREELAIKTAERGLEQRDDRGGKREKPTGGTGGVGG